MQIGARDTDIVQHLVIPLAKAEDRLAITAGDNHP
jgi:hypothetical protein